MQDYRAQMVNLNLIYLDILILLTFCTPAGYNFCEFTDSFSFASFSEGFCFYSEDARRGFCWLKAKKHSSNWTNVRIYQRIHGMYNTDLAWKGWNLINAYRKVYIIAYSILRYNIVKQNKVRNLKIKYLEISLKY